LYGTPKVVYTGVAKTLIVWVRLRGKNSLFVKIVARQALDTAAEMD